MNKRIKELAKQAAKKHGHTIKFSPEITETFQSFAKLIVRECAYVAWVNTPETKELDYSHLISDKIKEHFGVEE